MTGLEAACGSWGSGWTLTRCSLWVRAAACQEAPGLTLAQSHCGLIHSTVTRAHPRARLGLGTGTWRCVGPRLSPHGAPSLGGRQTCRVRDHSAMWAGRQRERHLACLGAVREGFQGEVESELKPVGWWEPTR